MLEYGKLPPGRSFTAVISLLIHSKWPLLTSGIRQNYLEDRSMVTHIGSSI